MAGAAFMGIWIFPFFGLLNTKSTLLIVVALVIGLPEERRLLAEQG